MDKFRIWHSTIGGYIVYLSMPGIIKKINHMLPCKASLGNFKRIDSYAEHIIDFSAIKLEINNKIIK